jgi:hypothetical protein
MARAHVGAALAAQRDFNEADRVFRGTTFRTPRIRLMLVALYGHLGMPSECRDELAGYAASTSVPIDTMAGVMSRHPGIRGVILEGLDLAKALTAS